MVFYTQYNAPMGPLWLNADSESLTGLWMDDSHARGEWRDELPVFAETRQWLDTYFRGEKPPMDALPLAPRGTEFQMLIWGLLLDIPFGQTRTYGDLAKEAALRMGKAKMSAQAVGGAVGANPISIIIPCHRVIGAGGKLTGYAGGLDKKEWLLRHEEVIK